jgi:general secretion pathway protein L
VASPKLLLKGRMGGESWSWLALDGTGRSQGGGHGDLVEAARAGTGRQCIWLVESEDVRLFERQLAARGRKQLEKAVPYALEDELAEEIDDLHFAFIADGEQITAAVAGKQLLRDALGALAEQGLYPAKAVPDVLALPLAPGSWSLAVESERALLRTGVGSGLACEPDLIGVLLSASLANTPEEARPSALQVWSCGSEVDLRDLQGLAVEHKPCESVLALLSQGLGEGVPIDLLQGELSLRGRSAKALRRWWPAAAALVVWAAVAMVDRAIEVHRLKVERDLLTQEIQQVFRDTFPGSRLVDAPQQMRQSLALLKGEQGKDLGFLAMLADAVDALEAEPSLKLTGMEFRNQVLELSLEADDVQQLDAVRKALETETVRAEIQAVNVEAGRAAGRIRVREARG